jgi:RNA polymerase sigma factor (sigma-70 family)
MDTKQPFEQVVAHHGATVLRVCRAVVGPTDADDVWSEAFLAALRAYPELAADANVEAWLVTITHRKAIDHLRARARRATPVAEVPERASTADDPANHDDGVWSHVKDLPDKQRQVIAYRYLGGLSYAQVAELVGGSADAARRAAADGIATLRARLPETTGGHP